MTDQETLYEIDFLEIYMCYSVMQLHITGIGVVWRRSVGEDGAGTETKLMGTETDAAGAGRGQNLSPLLLSQHDSLVQ
jgi:hypothetical protein